MLSAMPRLKQGERIQARRAAQPDPDSFSKTVWNLPCDTTSPCLGTRAPDRGALYFQNLR